MPGEHAAEHRHGVEEQALPAGDRQPEPQPRQEHRPADGLDEQGEQEYRQVGHEEEGQPRQVVGEEQPLPPHGQGAEEVGGPGVIEVAAHRHGAQRPEEHRQRQGQLDQVPHLLGKGLHIPAREAGAGLGLQLEHHQPLEGQDQQPDDGVRRPHGPVAQDRFLEYGAVKERCPGPHSPHLPSHR